MRAALLAAGSIALASGALPGCGGKKDTRVPSTWANFDCKDRKASYFVVGAMAAPEAGVAIECASGPLVRRWTVDRDGTEVEDSKPLTPGEFEDVWKRIEGVGWRNLDDCPPEGGGDVPVYQFDLADYNGSASFQCDALRPPFPWITLVDELDQLAATIRGDRGKGQLELDDSELGDP